jgi:protein arginine kinase activator
MLCDICKEKEATVHLTQMVEGKTKKIDLCEDCSKAKGVDDPAGFSLADLLLGLGASQEMEESESTKEKCPKCGFSQGDFKKTGRLGCPDCYDHFSEGVEGLLKSMHKGTRHTGKAPAVWQQTKVYVDRLHSLKSKLDKAVAKEDYEKAAKLRDEISRIKSEFAETKED